MIFEPDESSDGEVDSEEEKKIYEDVTTFVYEISTEKDFALFEEVESEIFNVSFIDNKQQNAIQRISPEVDWHAVVEKGAKDEIEGDVDDQ